ncbi:interferon-inducible GTPase 5-like [Seriola lalandi dorsalis]|uniref:interferon-inducible GTPase 5-like n=1 Tax=Seriola lalandi dorsalis TaxID=1841481 RepID=UPI000C6F9807|nr:interferon-inducible GTPase 5-like [Seriola lalandi dorsalis]
MDDPFDSYPEMEEIKEIREELQTNGPASAAAMIQEYLDQQNNIPLNIGITGESGSGKSTFVNAFRGIDNRDEKAAPTGVVETTSDVAPYPHPNYPNVTLWDLPGIGTTSFPADKYLQHVGFEKFDFFIIISADRFRENDVKLAQEIQRSLQEQGVESPQVFLVSSFELHLHDFHLLQETLERELPAHKRNALLCSLPNISREIINKKKKVLQSEIKYSASLSTFIAAVPVPGLSVAVDLAILIKSIVKYQATFGLDSESLQNLAHTTGVPLADLKAVMTSPLAAGEITKELVMNTLLLSSSTAALMEVEEGSRFIPIIGIPIAMGLSFTTTYLALSSSLNMLAEDAQKVFTRALGLNTSV